LFPVPSKRYEQQRSEDLEVWWAPRRGSRDESIPNGVRGIDPVKDLRTNSP